MMRYIVLVAIFGSFSIVDSDGFVWLIFFHSSRYSILNHGALK